MCCVCRNDVACARSWIKWASGRVGICGCGGVLAEAPFLMKRRFRRRGTTWGRLDRYHI